MRGKPVMPRNRRVSRMATTAEAAGPEGRCPLQNLEPRQTSPRDGGEPSRGRGAQPPPPKAVQVVRLVPSRSSRCASKARRVVHIHHAGLRGPPSAQQRGNGVKPSGKTQQESRRMERPSGGA